MTPTTTNNTTRSRTGPRAAAAYAAALLFFAAGAAGFTYYINAHGINLQKLEIHPASGAKLHTLPTAYPNEDRPVWIDTGRRDPISKEIEAELGTTNHATRYYVTTDTAPGEEPDVIQLHAAYYTGLIDTVPHVPERCFVGGGLAAVPGSTKVYPIDLDLSRLVPDVDHRDETGETIYRARMVEIPNRVRLPRGIEDLKVRITEFTTGGPQSVFAGYFFVANGNVVADAEQVRLQAFDLQSDYAFYMKVQFMSSTTDSAEELVELATSFLDNGGLAELMRRCPDWIDVEQGRHPAQNPQND